MGTPLCQRLAGPVNHTAAGSIVFGRQTARQGAASIGLATIAAKALGFVRELAIAYFFGAGAVVDAYRVGETLSGIFSGLARQGFDMAGVPLLVERRRLQGAESEYRFRAVLTTLALIFSAGVGVFTFVFAPALVRLLAPGLAPATFRTAVMVTRFMAPVILCTGLSSALGAAYNARRRFVLPRLFDPTVNTAAILVLLMTWGLGAAGLALGWTVGHILGVIVLLLPFVLAGRPLLAGLRHSGTAEFLRLAAPALLLGLVQPLNIAVGRAVASSLPTGSIAILGYAERLFMFPCFLLTASLSPVLLTRFSELAAARRTDELRRQTGRLLSRLALVLIPAGFAVSLIAEPLVRLVYLRGAFSSNAVHATAATLSSLSIGLYSHVAATVLAVSFRGRKEVRTPVIALLAGAVCNVCLALLLAKPLGLAGLGLAVTAGQTTAAAILGFRFYRGS